MPNIIKLEELELGSAPRYALGLSLFRSLKLIKAVVSWHLPDPLDPTVGLAKADDGASIIVCGRSPETVT